MAKRKKPTKIPDLKEELGTLKEQKGGIVNPEVIEKLHMDHTDPPSAFNTPAEGRNNVNLTEMVNKFKKVKMPPTSEIFSIKDQGNSKLVIKKDGTKLTIPK